MQGKLLLKRAYPYVPYLLFAYAVFTIFSKIFFVYPRNLLLNFPFITFDGFQWVTDGLHYVNSEIDVIQRNPALPLIFAALKYFRAENLYPFLSAVLTLVFYLTVYDLLSRMFERSIATLTSFCFFFVFKIHNFFDYILADPWCLTFLTASFCCLLRTLERPSFFIFFALLLAISFNFQFMPAFYAPALLFYLYRLFKSGWINENKTIMTLGALAFAAVSTPQFIYKYLKFGDPMYSKVGHFGVLGFHLWGIPYYFIGYLSFVGIPLALLSFVGLFKSLRRRSFFSDFFVLLLLSNSLFWIFFYKWLDVRFLLYFMPPAAVFLAKGIEAIFPLGVAQFSTFGNLKKGLVVLGFVFGVNMAAVKNSAFTGNELPLVPGISVVYQTEKISPPHWTDNIVLNQYSIQHSLGPKSALPALTYRKFYRHSNQRNVQITEWFENDIRKINSILAGLNHLPPKAIAICDGLFEDHAMKNAIFWHLGLNVTPCDVQESQLALTIKQHKVKKSHETINVKHLYEGNYFNLIAR
jgi:hypothetical protein